MVSINYFSNCNNPNSNSNTPITDPYNKAKQQEGIPLDKLLFSTDVVTPSTEAEKVQEILDAYDKVGPLGRAALQNSNMPVALQTLKEAVRDDVGNAKAILSRMVGGNKLQQQKYLHLVTSIMHANRKMIIGKALSFGRPGEPFDICLGGSNSM